MSSASTSNSADVLAKILRGFINVNEVRIFNFQTLIKNLNLKRKNNLLEKKLPIFQSLNNVNKAFLLLNFLQIQMISIL